VTFLGYRIDRALHLCMQHIDAQRDGADPANILTLEPEFADHHIDPHLFDAAQPRMEELHA
jgi:hypothetical protein